MMALLGCQPSAPPAPTAPTTGQLVTEVERVLPGVKDKIAAQQASGAGAPSKPANDPLKDVALPGPVVPYFNPLTEAEITEGWISLFDGHSLFGWESNAADVNWSVADGAITADAGPKGLLLTYTPFADYQFRCDYRMAAGADFRLLELVDEHMVGEPFDAAEERAAQKRDWR